MLKVIILKFTLLLLKFYALIMVVCQGRSVYAWQEKFSLHEENFGLQVNECLCMYVCQNTSTPSVLAEFKF